MYLDYVSSLSALVKALRQLQSRMLTTWKLRAAALQGGVNDVVTQSFGADYRAPGIIHYEE